MFLRNMKGIMKNFSKKFKKMFKKLWKNREEILKNFQSNL